MSPLGLSGELVSERQRCVPGRRPDRAAVDDSDLFDEYMDL